MASASLPQSSLLSIADDMVRIFQSLVTVLSDYYEASLSSRDGPSIGACMSSLVPTCHDLHQKLAVLWPCEKQFVAVLGTTGCGKSTLLNLLLSMMCSYGSTYTQGIKADSIRAVLRDTARVHVQNAGSCPITAELQDEDASKSSEATPSDALCSNKYIQDDLLVKEQGSLEGLLGICCAQDRQSYMSKHLPSYDSHPFILRNGRMGGAGTTKVTSVEYGPKFVGHIRWMTRKKLRRKLRDLRQVLDNGECATTQEQCLKELTEFWRDLRQLVNLPSSADRPTEEDINSVIDYLGTKGRLLLDKEDRIEAPAAQGCTVDRVFVREGIQEKLQQQLGKLIEDLRIEVPVASFEGGVSLLDVPGTNDPRVLHQRETRDAIDRTSLILLVLDKSVMDAQTEASLVQSLLLERMLMDETARCSLVVVGIAEKHTKKGQSPKDVLAGFDPKGTISKTLRKVFQKIASRLWKSKRIQKEHALNRIENLLTNSVILIPVLPFLCASLHLTPSNPKLHEKLCQSEGKINCPLRMSKEELRERCMETNIPDLLEKLHSVRVPPAKEELSSFLSSTLNGLKLLTEQNMVDSSYVDFLETEQAQACSVSSEQLRVKSDQVVVNIQSLNDELNEYAGECKLEPNDIDEICNTVGKDLLSQLQTGHFLLGPFILRGFCPEVIGQKANNLISSVDVESKRYTDQAYDYLCSLRGDAARIEAVYEKMENGSLALAVGLHEQLYNKWKLLLHRLRAKLFCGGIDGGLLGQVREALRKAYDGALKHLSKELKKSRNCKEALRVALEGNSLGVRAANVAKVEVEKALDVFLKNLFKSMNAEIQFLWKSWQDDIGNLAKSTRGSLRIHKEGERNPNILLEMKAGDERFDLFQKKLEARIKELEALQRRLSECVSQSHGAFEYGYSLLQSDCAADIMNCERQLCTADGSRPGGQTSERCSSKASLRLQCLDNQTRLNEPIQDGDSRERAALSARKETDNQAGKRDAHFGCADAGSSHKLLGASSGAVNVPKLGSFLGKSSRRAQVLSEVESVKLQKRESFAKRFKKQ